MSANLPPSFKPIAHYIKIANENASRDPVIYYWSLVCMALGSAFSPIASFNESSWRRLQKTILVEKESIERRDSLRDSIDNPDPESMEVHLKSEEIAAEIQQKTVNCDELRAKIAAINAKILIGKRKTAEIDEKLAKKREDEGKLERKVEQYEKVNGENSERKTKEKRVISIMIRLLSCRKLALIEEIFAIFKLKIDGGPASSRLAPRNCNCQVIDSIRGIHLPQLSYIFNHPEAQTYSALQNTIHLFDAICRILNFAPKYSTESLMTLLKSTWKKRADREKFVDSMIALGKNISQLREACGIPTMATDRTLGTLEEWHRFVIQKKTVFERPIQSVFSPANLMIDMNIIGKNQLK
ncbi:hypothetical protein CRE_20430 [Caenorhabditis remanei]|uniref:Uncharacterized protein n=1 Tax=Caenorhabditis remanei TaxID=31234 RepID=E3MT60_CAERE|nr:hypothetical protein CRE_20430 [Caenorhabditis remanei]